MFLTMIVSLYTVRVIIQTLSVQDYGIYGAVGGVILSFSFISGVLTNASQRYFSYELGKGRNGKIKEIFSTIFISYLVISFLIVFLAETLGLWFVTQKMIIPLERESAAMWVYQFALLSFITTILTNPYQAIIIAHEKMNIYAYLSILEVLLKLAIVFVLMTFEGDKLKLYAVLMFVSCLITSGSYILYCINKYPETCLMLHLDRPLLKSIFSYSSWTLFGTFSGMCNTQGMNLVLNVFFGPIANAAYSVSTQIYHAVGQFANNFYVAVKPALIKNYSSGNMEYVNQLFIFSSKAIFALLYVIILPILICTEEILLLWLGQLGEYMIVFVKLSLIYTLILTISYPITAVAQAGGNVRLYHGLVDTFSLLALPLMYLLFRLGFSASYAYIVSIIIFSLAHIIRLYVLRKVLATFSLGEYMRCFAGPALIVAIVSYFIMLYVKCLMSNDIISVFLTCGVSFTVVILLCAIVLFTKRERSKVLTFFKK